MTPCLYVGQVRHRRRHPVGHAFTYPCVFFLLDLDRLPQTARSLRLFGHDRPNLISFFERDHADGGPGPIRPKIDRLLRHHGVDLEGGTIALLTQCRMLHYVFNPVSFYYAWNAGGALRAIVAEVNSTFGERHFYVLPARDPDRAVVRAAADKALHVSPFLSMEARYDFRFTTPGERVSVAIVEHERGRHVLDTVLRGARRELSDRSLLWLCARYPLLTLRVTLGIHAQALRLWRKGAPLYPQPPPTAESLRELERMRS